VIVKGGKTAHIQWLPPNSGNYHGFKLKVIYKSNIIYLFFKISFNFKHHTIVNQTKLYFIFQVISLSNTGLIQQEQFYKIFNISSQSNEPPPKESQQYILKDLIPGATYQLHLFTVYDHKESVAYISKNFTTSNN